MHVEPGDTSQFQPQRSDGQNFKSWIHPGCSNTSGGSVLAATSLDAAAFLSVFADHVVPL